MPQYNFKIRDTGETFTWITEYLLPGGLVERNDKLYVIVNPGVDPVELVETRPLRGHPYYRSQAIEVE